MRILTTAQCAQLPSQGGRRPLVEGYSEYLGDRHCTQWPRDMEMQCKIFSQERWGNSLPRDGRYLAPTPTSTPWHTLQQLESTLSFEVATLFSGRSYFLCEIMNFRKSLQGPVVTEARELSHRKARSVYVKKEGNWYVINAHLFAPPIPLTPPITRWDF